MGDNNRYKTKLEFVSAADFAVANVNYRKINKNYPLHWAFCDFLGYNRYFCYPNNGMFTHNAAKKIQMLCSPHHVALFAVHRVRVGKLK